MFADPPRSLYLLSMLVAACLVGAWLAKPTRRRLLVAALGVGLPLLLFLVDSMLETPREEVVRRIEAVAKASTSENLTLAADQISDSFNYNGLTKRTFPALFQKLKSIGATGIAVWELSPENFKELSAGKVEQGFMVKARGFELSYYVVVVFEKDAGGRWLATGMRAYDMLQRDNGSEKPIPVQW